MHKVRLSLNWSREILARERRQTEESQYYKEQEGCFYESRIGRNWIFFILLWTCYETLNAFFAVFRYVFKAIV